MRSLTEYKNRVSINLLMYQKSTLLSIWNDLQIDPVRNKVKIQHLDGLINLLDVIGDKLIDEGEVNLIEDKF